eukprot:scaffold4.g5001.t1
MSASSPAQAVFAAGLLAHAAAQQDAITSDSLCFNELQVIGSHNSYHIAPPEAITSLYGGGSGGPLLAWQYSQPPLPEQLDAGIRAFELDINWDPDGGLYSQAAGLKLANASGWLDDADLKQPGFKVLHIPDFDWRSTCTRFTACLGQVKVWSDAHPGHLPIRVYLEVKEPDDVKRGLGDLLYSLVAAATAPGPSSLVQPHNFTQQTFKDLASEVSSVFGGDCSAAGGQLLTPDGMRVALGAAPRADLTRLLVAPPGGGACAWPPLDRLRGKVLLLLILGSQQALSNYLSLYPDLQGAPAWVTQMQAGDGARRDGRAADERRAAPATSRPSDARSGSLARRLAPPSTSPHYASPLAHHSPQGFSSPFNDIFTNSLSSSFGLALPANVSGRVERQAGQVKAAVEAGFVVRARADADTIEARANYTARQACCLGPPARDAVLDAGAHVVATDYPASVLRVLKAEGGGSSNAEASAGGGSSGSSSSAGGSAAPLFATSYSVALPGGQPGRCVNGGSVTGAALKAESAGGGNDGDIIYCGGSDPTTSSSGSSSNSDGGSSGGSSGGGATAATSVSGGSRARAASCRALVLGAAAWLLL